LRFIGAVHHDHGFTDTKADCASCFMAHQLSDVPPPTHAVTPAFGVVTYPILRGALNVYATHARKVQPQAQGPPSQNFPI
jgi:hypothetical protein